MTAKNSSTITGCYNSTSEGVLHGHDMRRQCAVRASMGACRMRVAAEVESSSAARSVWAQYNFLELLS